MKSHRFPTLKSSHHEIVTSVSQHALLLFVALNVP